MEFNKVTNIQKKLINCRKNNENVNDGLKTNFIIPATPKFQCSIFLCG